MRGKKKSPVLMIGATARARLSATTVVQFVFVFLRVDLAGKGCLDALFIKLCRHDATWNEIRGEIYRRFVYNT